MRPKYYILFVLLVSSLLNAVLCAYKYVEGVRIITSDRSYASTSGKIRFGVRQGSKSCETIRATIEEPKRNNHYSEYRQSKFGSCRYTSFDTLKKLEFRVLSDSGDDAYINMAAILIDGRWREWRGYQVKVNKHGEGNAWRTAIEGEFRQ